MHVFIPVFCKQIIRKLAVIHTAEIIIKYRVIWKHKDGPVYIVKEQL